MVKSRVRLADIAARTGFSKNTVSLALRDSARLPQATRELIQQTARELHYLPNHVAKSLTSRETKTIGLVLADLGNPTLTQASKAIETALKRLGYGTLFATSNNDPAEEREAIRMFRSRQVDGMLVYPTRSQGAFEHLVEERKSGSPLVLLMPGPDVGVEMVGVDETLGAYKAVRHLIGLGHRDIATVDNNKTRTHHQKFDGYLRALEEAGIAFRSEWQVDPMNHTPAGGYAAMQTLMQQARPTAVFVANDYIAMGVMSWCFKHGVRVPEDVAIIGFDNIEMSEFLPAPLSSVNYEIEHVTRTAIERLMLQIDARGVFPAPEVTLIEPQLVIRASTQRAAAVRDADPAAARARPLNRSVRP